MSQFLPKERREGGKGGSKDKGNRRCKTQAKKSSSIRGLGRAGGEQTPKPGNRKKFVKKKKWSS